MIPQTSRPTQKPEKKTGQNLTVVVFKDNFASRTFQVPFRWITSFSILTTAFTILTIVSIVFSARLYFGSSESIRSHTIDRLNKNLESIQQDNDFLKRRLENLTSNKQDGEMQNPILFTGLPATVRPPDHTTEPPVEISDLDLSWTNRNTLRVQFNLRYTKKDTSSQQGRIIILARGPGKILAYPNEALNPPGKDSLIEVSKGEYFSVSRFRKVDTTFGPFSGKSDLTHIEVLLFSSNLETLLIETFPLNENGEVKPK